MSGDLAMLDSDQINFTFNVFAHSFYNVDRSMASAGATDRYRQVGAILCFKYRSPVKKKLGLGRHLTSKMKSVP